MGGREHIIPKILHETTVKWWKIYSFFLLLLEWKEKTSSHRFAIIYGIFDGVNLTSKLMFQFIFWHSHLCFHFAFFFFFTSYWQLKFSISNVQFIACINSSQNYSIFTIESYRFIEILKQYWKFDTLLSNSHPIVYCFATNCTTIESSKNVEITSTVDAAASTHHMCHGGKSIWIFAYFILKISYDVIIYVPLSYHFDGFWFCPFIYLLMLEKTMPVVSFVLSMTLGHNISYGSVELFAKFMPTHI